MLKIVHDVGMMFDLDLHTSTLIPLTSSVFLSLSKDRLFSEDR